MGERRASLRLLHFLGIAAVLLSRGCSHDWDGYDPRLAGSSSAGSGGQGGAGSTASQSSGQSSATSASSSSAGPGGGSSSSQSSSSESSSSQASSSESSSSQASSSQSSSSGVMICMPNLSQPCYDGHPGTQNNLPCKEGIQICDGMGTSWGPCLMEVTPIPEDCATAVDDDCNGMPNDHCGLWAKRFGDAVDQSPYGMAVSPSGHIVITGTTLGTIDFGGGPWTGAGGGDVFVAEFDATGAHLWSHIYGDASPQNGVGVAFDSVGNVYVTGAFEGTISFGAGPGLTLTSAGLSDIFVAKLDPSGNGVWAKSFGDANGQAGNAVAADAAGNVFLAGEFDGTVDFGAGPKTALGTDGVIVKFDPTGAVLWSYTFGASGNDYAGSVAIAPSGNVVVGGGFTTKAIFGGTTLTGKGQTDMFVAKLSAAGAPLWAHSYGTSADEWPGSVAVDSGGNVLFDTFFGGPLDAGCGSLPNVGSQDLLVVKLDSSGQCVWSQGFGNPTAGSKSPVLSVDGAGNVLVTDEFVGVTDFGGGPISVANPHDVLVLKLDPAGQHLWSRRFGNSSDQDGRAIGADSAGNVYVLAELSGSINFGTGTLNGAGGNDVCIAKLAP